MSALFWPLIKVCEWLSLHEPETLVKIRFFAKFKRFPRLKHPVDLNEKILWMKLYSDVSTWAELADKYRVRSYLESLGLSKYLVKLYGKWDSIQEIDFSNLPPSLIFKVNNGDGKGTNLIIKDLPKADKTELLKIFNKWLTRTYIGDLSAEPQYKLMKPCIIAEELLLEPKESHSLIDYKIWCINGQPKFIWTCSDRDEDGGGAEVMTYDLEWNAHPEFSVFTHEYRHGKLLDKPKNLSEMIELATKLSKPFPILRVDLYNIDGYIYFGELTFTSQGGMMDFYSQEFLDLLGKQADISKIAKVRNI